MALLLDTHVLLWTLDVPKRLPQKSVAQIESPDSTVYFSAARIREIAIKTALEKSISVIRPGRSRGLRGILASPTCLSARRMTRRPPGCPRTAATPLTACRLPRFCACPHSGSPPLRRSDPVRSGYGLSETVFNLGNP